MRNRQSRPRPSRHSRFLRSRTFAFIWAVLCLVCLLRDLKCVIKAPIFSFKRSFLQSNGPELSILMVIYNKAHYLNRSMTSILKLPIEHSNVEIICVDDGSTDNSVDIIHKFQEKDDRIKLYKNGENMGTHITRINAVLYTKTPFLTFLDPDDELIGRGVQRALDFIKTKDADIVEFGCQMVVERLNMTNVRCWKVPKVDVATPSEYTKLYYRGRVNCHLHRKIFRTELYQNAINTMPDWIRSQRIIRYEDKLQYAFIVNLMTRNFYYLPVLGEIRYYGLVDNSQSECYQSKNESKANDKFVSQAIRQLFHKTAR